MKTEEIFGTLLTFVGEEHIYTFMLSSPFTARNLGKEKGDIANIKTDLGIALALSIFTSILAGILTKSALVSLSGIGFALLLFYIYWVRSEF